MQGAPRRLAVAAALGLASGSAAADDLYLEYTHTPFYAPADSAVEADVHGHALGLGAYLEPEVRVGIHHEQLEGNFRAQIRGISADYELLGSPGWAGRAGVMLGSHSGGLESGPVGDLYAGVAMRGMGQAAVEARLAYRHMPDDALAELADETSGVYLSLGFSLHL